jgi:hypothetical protein
MPTVQIQLILENYLVIIVPCMAKTRENIRVLLRRIMKMKSRLQFLANLKLIGIPCIEPKSDSNGNIMGYEAAKSHYVL